VTYLILFALNVSHNENYSQKFDSILNPFPTLSTQLLDPSNSAHPELLSHVAKRVPPNALAVTMSHMLPLDVETQGDIDAYDKSGDQDFVASELGSTSLLEQDEEI
jgi:hypothetical protein